MALFRLIASLILFMNVGSNQLPKRWGGKSKRIKKAVVVLFDVPLRLRSVSVLFVDNAFIKACAPSFPISLHLIIGVIMRVNCACY